MTVVAVVRWRIGSKSSASWPSVHHRDFQKKIQEIVSTGCFIIAITPSPPENKEKEREKSTQSSQTLPNAPRVFHPRKPGLLLVVVPGLELHAPATALSAEQAGIEDDGSLNSAFISKWAPAFMGFWGSFRSCTRPVKGALYRMRGFVRVPAFHISLFQGWTYLLLFPQEAADLAVYLISSSDDYSSSSLSWNRLSISRRGFALPFPRDIKQNHAITGSQRTSALPVQLREQHSGQGCF